VASKVTALRKEGNVFFINKDYDKALTQFDTAIKLLPEAAVERSDLFCNKAACFYQLKR